MTYQFLRYEDSREVMVFFEDGRNLVLYEGDFELLRKKGMLEDRF